MKKRVVVGMSGGVDSSLSALLLKEQGYEVVGLFMRNWHETGTDGCCTADEDFYDVRAVCNTLDIPYYSVDFADVYYENVFAHFLDEYKKGRTPNPDVLCNREIKFGAFLEHALTFGADYVATGHYANVRHCGNGVNYLLKAKDANKDQTYFLNQVDGQRLERVLFPVGNLTKPEVRALSARYGLKVARKKDSTGICFIGERRFREFLAQYIPMREGEIKTLDGHTVGRHQGVFYYTVGQRKGLGLGGTPANPDGGAWFVVKKDAANNVLYVAQGNQSALFHNALICDAFHFIPCAPRERSFRCTARIRHRQPEQDATAELLGDGGVRVTFDRPQRAIAEGQYCVLYRDEICLGGGVIESVFDA